MGAPWKDLPAGCGDDATCHRRFQKWSRDGIFEAIRRAVLQAIVDGAEWTSRKASFDATFMAGKKAGPASALANGARGRNSRPSSPAMALLFASPFTKRRPRKYAPRTNARSRAHAQPQERSPYPRCAPGAPGYRRRRKDRAPLCSTRQVASIRCSLTRLRASHRRLHGLSQPRARNCYAQALMRSQPGSGAERTGETALEIAHLGSEGAALLRSGQVASAPRQTVPSNFQWRLYLHHQRCEVAL